MIVVANTTPLNYLVLIDQVALLPRLFGRILIPPAVWEELSNAKSPELVRAWLILTPAWLQVQSLSWSPDQRLEHIDRGEQEVITLAQELAADQVLLDETEARQEAARRNLPVIGTLGVLRRAAQLNWIVLASALAELQETTFYVRPELIDSLLQEDLIRRKKLD